MDPEITDKLIEDSTVISQALNSSKLSQNEKETVVTNYLKSINHLPIPNIPKDIEWFNVSEPLTLVHIAGNVVLLDFFTYCCINCMHILPNLKQLEKKYPVEDGFIVIGIHSAKFENEKDSTNILSAVKRYGIEHPVMNDSEMILWNNLNIGCWPTLLLIGPESQPLLLLMGEGHKNVLELFISGALKYYKKINKIIVKQIPLAPSMHLASKNQLYFPGKVTCFDNKLLAISDSGNHRIIVAQLNGEIKYVIGSNKPGLKDGQFNECCFNSPQGLIFLNEKIIFVADTENHAIREINLDKMYVSTILGNGKQGNDRIGGKIGSEQEISSPWDLAIYKVNNTKMNEEIPIILIAMAGTHQIWALFLRNTIWWKGNEYKAGSCHAIVGSGKEENRNNSYPMSAGFAQPSGLAILNDEVYVADSESSSVRRVSLVDGKVTAVVGGNRQPTNLFDFGDKDGQLYDAKLQHPLGVAALLKDNLIVVADSYNHKIKQINVKTNTATLLICKDLKDESIQKFNEPGGLCTVVIEKDEYIFVADTNNHCIKKINLSTLQVSKFELIFPDNLVNKLASKINTIKLKTDGKVKINFNISFDFDTGLKLTENAPHKVEIKFDEQKMNCDLISNDFKNPLKFSVTVPQKLNDKFILSIYVIVCKGSKCLPIKNTFEFEIERETNGTNLNFEEIEKKLNFLVTEKSILWCS